MLYISSCLIFKSVCIAVITFVIHRLIIHESMIHTYLSMIIHELFVNKNMFNTQQPSLGDISRTSVIKILNQKLFTHSHQSQLNQSCLNTTNVIVIRARIDKKWLTLRHSNTMTLSHEYATKSSFKHDSIKSCSNIAKKVLSCSNTTNIVIQT